MVSIKNVLLGVVGAIVGLPILILIFALVLVYLVTLVGPLYHLYRRRQERQLLDNVTRRHPDLHFLETARGRLCYRWTQAGQQHVHPSVEEASPPGAGEDAPLLIAVGSSHSSSEPRIAGWGSQTNGRAPANSHRFPVLLPGGLGSTLLATAVIHDRMVQLGFDVLSFDRLGVGFSDDLSNMQRQATPQQQMERHIAEMHALVEHVAPSAKWIVVGGSFGSTVGQLFAARHPEHIAGFVNWDGLPSGLSAIEGQRASFDSVSSLYAMEAKCMSLGLFRFAIWAALNRYDVATVFQHSQYTFAELYAQLNGSKMLQAIANEAPLMMACCDLLTEQWSTLSYTHLSATFCREVEELSPHVVVPGEGFTDDGITYASHQQLDEWTRLRAVLCDTLQASPAPPTPLLQLWQTIPVRSLSNRDFDYDKSERFISAAMKQHYAVEHSILALFARDGKRIVFPGLTHMGSLKQSAHLNAAILEIAALAEQWRQEVVPIHHLNDDDDI